MKKRGSMQNKLKRIINCVLGWFRPGGPESPMWTDVPYREGWWGVYTEYEGEWLPVMLEKFVSTFHCAGPLSDYPFRVEVSTCDEYDGALVRDDGSLDIAGDKHEAYWYRIDLPPNPDEV